MITALFLLIFIVSVGALVWFSVAKLPSFAVILALLVVFFLTAPILLSIVLSVLTLLVGAVLFVKPLRYFLVSQPLLKYVRQVLPPMSETEREALDAGDVWVEGDLFRGEPKWSETLSLRKPSLTLDEQTFIDKECEELCAMIDDWAQMSTHQDLSPEVWQFIKEKGFLGLIIPKQYGGKAFSAFAHSTVVSKIASRSVSSAVSVMVPNSLGPAELLMHYGTDKQKSQYLPKLASGQDIPCFALTAPNAGSDAGAITDSGVVCYQGDKLCIRLSWDKRYITLAPVATLLGLAFKLFDPDNLLGKNKKSLGITLALIPTTHPGVEIGNRHIPLGLPFMNGSTRGTDVVIPLDWIIGGEEQAGQGWRMLMECLSIGRSISLPALASASAKLSYRMTGAYAKIRKQFRTSIGDFEGVQEALSRIGGYTYMMESVRLMTSDAVSQGIKPSLVSAITKYHLTEMGRVVINDAMDVHAGKGIQCGPRNYIGLHYIGVPISITVEGANILTRNLMIFGQGAMRCHPFIQAELQAVNNSNPSVALAEFDSLLLSHAAYSLNRFTKTLVSSLTAGQFIATPKRDFTAKFYRQLTRMSYALSFTSDVALALLGGNLKRRERLSARLGDVLSHLYIAMATLKYYEDNEKTEEDNAYLTWSIQTCLYKIQIAFDDFFQNFPYRGIAFVLRKLIFPFGRAYKAPADSLSQSLAEAMQRASAFRDRLTKHCYQGAQDSATGRIEKAFELAQSSASAYKKLRSALSNGQVSRDETLDNQIKAAILSGILTSDEGKLLNELEAATEDALEVDEFDEVKWPIRNSSHG